MGWEGGGRGVTLLVPDHHQHQAGIQNMTCTHQGRQLSQCQGCLTDGLNCLSSAFLPLGGVRKTGLVREERIGVNIGRVGCRGEGVGGEIKDGVCFSCLQAGAGGVKLVSIFAVAPPGETRWWRVGGDWWLQQVQGTTNPHPSPP